jgi:hypothetical protein
MEAPSKYLCQTIHHESQFSSPARVEFANPGFQFSSIVTLHDCILLYRNSTSRDNKFLPALIQYSIYQAVFIPFHLLTFPDNPLSQFQRHSRLELHTLPRTFTLTNPQLITNTPSRCCITTTITTPTKYQAPSVPAPPHPPPSSTISTTHLTTHTGHPQAPHHPHPAWTPPPAPAPHPLSSPQNPEHAPSISPTSNPARLNTKSGSQTVTKVQSMTR